MAGKKFRFRSDGNNRVGIKEVITRSTTMRGPRISVSVGLDSNFNLSEQYGIKNNILLPLSEKSSNIKFGRAIYYPIDRISYISTITLQYNKTGKLIEQVLTIYVPVGICSFDEIYSIKVTTSVGMDLKKVIMSNAFDYIVSKV